MKKVVLGTKRLAKVLELSRSNSRLFGGLYEKDNLPTVEDVIFAIRVTCDVMNVSCAVDRIEAIDVQGNKILLYTEHSLHTFYKEQGWLQAGGIYPRTPGLMCRW